MPRLSDSGEDEESLLEAGRRRSHRLINGFLDFIASGNEIAFGLIIAAAFTTLVTSFVTDIILPPLAVLLPVNKNLDEKFAVLRQGKHFDEYNGYNTLKQAQEDGAVVMAYGAFLNRLINFLGLGLSLYGLAGLYQCISKDPIIKHTVKCKYCRKRISEKALRCVNCSSWQDGREDIQ